MKLILAAAIFVVALSASAFGQKNTSIYTSTRAESCRTIESNPDEAGSYEGECRGAGGYKLRVMEGDLRQALDVITPGKKRFELIKWGLFAGFSAIGDKVEWRMKGGVPVALIARYAVADPEGVGKGKSYLIVSKIGAKSSCVTDIVEPMAKQNEKARELADTAAGRPCKED
jgi:hypothetical protein